MLALAALAAFALATATAAPAAPGWRAFAPSSLWNLPVAPQSIAPSNPYAGQFAGSPGFAMQLSGTPDNPTYASPIYFAQPGDPVAPVNVTIPSWAPSGIIRYDGHPIPVPAGVKPAPGSDGHLTVVSADRKTAWEFWRCTQAGTGGYSASIAVQFDLTGNGWSDHADDTSARGSGMPLISTTLRAEEAVNGIQHALGFTVPSVSSAYIDPPATHSDGNDGPSAIKYGMLFALRPDYPVPAGASIGVRNVIAALKTYGAYVMDQGADFEMDADSTHPELWAQAGLNQNSLDIKPADFRPAKPGAAPPSPPTQQAGKPSKARVLISVRRRTLRRGGRLWISGRVVGSFKPKARVRIMVKSSGHRWRVLRRKRVEASGAFASSPRLSRTARTSGAGRTPHYLLSRLRLSRHTHRIKIRATVSGVGRSRSIPIKIKH